MNKQTVGGCFCGLIRYQFDGDEFPTANCHCTMCRRASGAPFVSWIVVPKNKFRYTTHTPKELESSSHGTRYFCDNCGTPIACEISSHPEVIDITICSLDAPENIRPKTDVHTDTKLPWIELRK